MRKLDQEISANETISFPSCKTFVFLRSEYSVSFKFITLFNRIDRTIENFQDSFSVTADTYFLRVEITSKYTQTLSCILIEDTKIEYTPITGDVFISNDESHRVPVDTPDYVNVKTNKTLFTFDIINSSQFRNTSENGAYQNNLILYNERKTGLDYQCWNLQGHYDSAVPSRIFFITSINVISPIDTELEFYSCETQTGFSHEKDAVNCSLSGYFTSSNTIFSGYKNLSTKPGNKFLSYFLKANENNYIEFINPIQVSRVTSRDYNGNYVQQYLTTKDKTPFDFVINFKSFFYNELKHNNYY